MKKKMTIVIATESDAKIEGIKNAICKFYPNEEYDLKIYSGKTESGVDDQPFGNDTAQGAINRITNAMEKYKVALNEQNILVDYYISCEAGIDDTNRIQIGDTDETLYASEQVVCIYKPSSDIYSFGKSSAWFLPKEVIDEIRKSNLDIYLRSLGCTGLQDIGNASNYITRSEAIEQATASALASLFVRERSKKRETTKNIGENDKTRF